MGVCQYSPRFLYIRTRLTGDWNMSPVAYGSGEKNSAGKAKMAGAVPVYATT